MALTLLPPPPGSRSSSGSGDLDVDGYIEDYLAGHRAGTADAYRRDIGHLRCYLDALGLDLLGTRRGDLAWWVRAQEDAGVPATTIRRRLAAVSGLYCYLTSEGLVESTPADGLRRPRGGSAPRLGLSAGELGRLLDAAHDRGVHAELLVCLLIICGLRVSEACALDDTDLVAHEASRGLRVHRKGGRVELVGLVDAVADRIDRVVATQGPGPLLRGRSGARLSRQVAWRWIERLGTEAGIGGKVYPHQLRHSFVSQALIAGVPLPVVAASAGHRDIRTTLRYAQALAALGAAAGEAVARRIAPP
ncbi:MAG: tyrosine-type recombinase/integrase [Acidimicrobiales bacterium]